MEVCLDKKAFLPNLVRTSCSSWVYSSLNLGTLTWTALSFGIWWKRSEMFSLAVSDATSTWPDSGMTTKRLMELVKGKLATCRMEWSACHKELQWLNDQRVLFRLGLGIFYCSLLLFFFLPEPPDHYQKTNLRDVWRLPSLQLQPSARHQGRTHL